MDKYAAKTQRDVSAPSEFLIKKEKREETVEEIKRNELDKYLCEFILRVELKHGEDYE